ncbi:MAG TPA: GNAT family N-acetyltransferase [Acidimicrobiales bacterium]
MTQVRRARPDDVDAWYRVLDEVASEGRWIGREAPVDRDDAAFLAWLERPDAAVFVAELDGELVGSIRAEVSFGIMSFGMWVAAAARGRGIGRALVDAVVAWAREVGAHKVSIEVWPHNERALRLYRSMGFVIEGRKRRHWRRRNGELWDSLLLGKVLDESSPASPYPDAPSARTVERPG